MTQSVYKYSIINRLDELPTKGFEQLLAYSTPTENRSLVLLCEYDFPLSRELWRKYMGYLPRPLQQDVMRYRKWEDRHNNLIGKLLVFLGYKLSKKETLDFSDYKRTEQGKPFVKGTGFNFNISHSKKVVVVAQDAETLGVDVEFIDDVDLRHFESVMNSKELEIVREEGLHKFFEFWTSKEAITKAIGEGLSIDVAEIACNEERVKYEGQHWPLLKFIYKDDFFITIASKEPLDDSRVLRIQF